VFIAVEILIALVVPGLVIVITAYLRSRERMRLLDVILQTSQSGHPVSPELLRTLPGGRELPAPQVDFRRGVMLIAIGVALAMIGVCVYFAIASAHGEGSLAWALSVAAVGAIPGCIGVALVVLSREDSRAVGS
jgi:hypothetical protein